MAAPGSAVIDPPGSPGQETVALLAPATPAATAVSAAPTARPGPPPTTVLTLDQVAGAATWGDGRHPATDDVLPTGGSRLVDRRAHAAGRRGRRAEQAVAAASALLGTIGFALAGILALLDAYSYAQPAACAAYSTAHRGAAAFGCSATAHRLAVALPALGLPLLVIGALALVWVPDHSPRRRGALLGALAAALIVVVGVAAAALDSLPRA